MKFQLWSPAHFIFILSPVIFAIATYFIFRRHSYRVKRLAGILFSVAAIVILLARNIEILVQNGGKIDPDIIPLQVCHFANFVLLLAFVLDNKSLFSFAFCFNLPAACMSIIFADSLTNYATILSARGIAYIMGHMLIVGITVYALIFKFVKITLKTYVTTIIIVLSAYVVSLFINNLFNVLMPEFTSNYFYSILPENGTPLELFFKWGKTYTIGSFQFNPLYMLLTALLGAIIVSAMFLIYRLIDYLRERTKTNQHPTQTNQHPTQTK